ncbi:MAG: hypothetical protein N2035_07290 [Chthoniobacterales bacterium]|nr:hypothetical protein [Chthoniobacterales bacterium]
MSEFQSQSSLSYARSINAAQGYIELGMYEEALKELAALPRGIAEHDEVLQLKLFLLMRLKSWEEALRICLELQRRKPNETLGYIQGAFCLHELGRTAEAKEMLLKGPSSLLREPTYHYNLACYEAVLGNREIALEYLRTSFSMNHAFREIAKKDPDLASLAGMF